MSAMPSIGTVTLGQTDERVLCHTGGRQTFLLALQSGTRDASSQLLGHTTGDDKQAMTRNSHFIRVHSVVFCSKRTES
jgi:hypothetical protein